MREKNQGVTVLVLEIMCKISLKWAFLAHFPRGAWGEFYKSWLTCKSNKFQTFQLTFINSQFNCIIFVKEQWNLQKLKFYLHAQKSCTLQNRRVTLTLLTSKVQMSFLLHTTCILGVCGQSTSFSLPID